MDNSTFTRCFSLAEHPDAVWEQCVYGDKGCPAACSGRGVCFFGVCHCKPGWLGSNCTAVESSRASCGLRGGVDLSDDACLQNSAYGAAVIPAGRWRVAQAAEARLWASNSTRRERDSGVPHRSGRKQRGDRAWMHVKQFGSYASLPRGSLGLVAELGAGPWTQTHFLLEARPDVTATKVTLIDPGIDGYLRSGRAIYADGRLHGIEAELLLSIPAERVPASYTERFDTLVMINVIEHTFNAFATLHTAHRLLKRGGIFSSSKRDASRSTPGLRSTTRYGLPNRSLMPFSPANTTRCSAFTGRLLRCAGRGVLMASTRKFTSLARSAKASMRCEAPHDRCRRRRNRAPPIRAPRLRHRRTGTL